MFELCGIERYEPHQPVLIVERHVPPVPVLGSTYDEINPLDVHDEGSRRASSTGSQAPSGTPRQRTRMQAARKRKRGRTGQLRT